jgi:hypothetical protein
VKIARTSCRPTISLFLPISTDRNKARRRRPKYRLRRAATPGPKPSAQNVPTSPIGRSSTPRGRVKLDDVQVSQSTPARLGLCYACLAAKAFRQTLEAAVWISRCCEGRRADLSELGQKWPMSSLEHTGVQTLRRAPLEALTATVKTFRETAKTAPNRQELEFAGSVEHFAKAEWSEADRLSFYQQGQSN